MAGWVSSKTSNNTQKLEKLECGLRHVKLRRIRMQFRERFILQRRQSDYDDRGEDHHGVGEDLFFDG